MTPPLRSAVAFRSAPADQFTWASWQGAEEQVVYHHASGKTHLLNEGSALMLQQVLLEPRSPLAAAELVASLQGAMADAQFVDHITQLLIRLEELGLVERVHP